jgi:hypothetical protein
MTFKQIAALFGLAVALFGAYKAIERVRREFGKSSLGA